MATFFRVLALIVKYGPTIWELVMEIIDLINEVSSYLPASEAAVFQYIKKGSLDNAVAYYRLTKDKGKLESMHGELTVQLSNFQNHRR